TCPGIGRRAQTRPRLPDQHPAVVASRLHTSWDGAATSASARPRESSRTSKRGSVEDCVCIFGGTGEPGKTASENYAIAAYRSSMRRWRPARPRASGECQDTRRSNRRCATAISTRSVFPESMRPSKLNSVEPPRYGSVCQVVWEGRCREASPYPDQLPFDHSNCTIITKPYKMNSGAKGPCALKAGRNPHQGRARQFDA